jgi:hypothetical protein
MSNTTVIRITHTKATAALGDVRKISGMLGASVQDVCNEIALIFERIACGLEQCTFEVQAGCTSAVRATGTLTIASGSGTVGASSIGGTAVTVTWATSDTATAAALAAAINANATTKAKVYATSALGVVTIKAMSPGTLGNSIALVATGTGVTASAATLLTGAGDDVIPVTFSRT